MGRVKYYLLATYRPPVGNVKDLRFAVCNYFDVRAVVGTEMYSVDGGY